MLIYKFNFNSTNPMAFGKNSKMIGEEWTMDVLMANTKARLEEEFGVEVTFADYERAADPKKQFKDKHSPDLKSEEAVAQYPGYDRYVKIVMNLATRTENKKGGRGRGFGGGIGGALTKAATSVNSGDTKMLVAGRIAVEDETGDKVLGKIFTAEDDESQQALGLGGVNIPLKGFEGEQIQDIYGKFLDRVVKKVFRKQD